MLKKIFRSPFIKSILTLVTGSSIAQAITLLVTPILSRIYSPADFGVFTFFMAIVGAFALIATLRYEIAIMLPKKDQEAVNIVSLSLIINALICIAILIVSIISFFTWFPLAKVYSPLKFWLLLMPVLVFLISSSNVFQNWFNRKKDYSNLAYSKIINSAGINLSTLALGLAGTGLWGLFTGNLIGLILFNIFFIIRIILVDKNKFKDINFLTIKKMARQYKDLPKANTPQVLLEMFQLNGIIYLLQIFFMPTIIGWYSFAYRILQAPMSLVGTSIAQVFYKDAAEKVNNSLVFKKLVIRTILLAALIALPIVIIPVIAGPWLFSFLFGSGWRQAGVYSQILAPWFFLDFIRYAIAQVPIIKDRMKTMLKFSITGNILLIFSLIVGGVIFKNIIITLIILSLLMCIYDICLIGWIYKISAKNNEK